jgi:hypothetical protein
MEKERYNSQQKPVRKVHEDILEPDGPTTKLRTANTVSKSLQRTRMPRKTQDQGVGESTRWPNSGHNKEGTPGPCEAIVTSEHWSVNR